MIDEPVERKARWARGERHPDPAAVVRTGVGRSRQLAVRRVRVVRNHPLRGLRQLGCCVWRGVVHDGRADRWRRAVSTGSSVRRRVACPKLHPGPRVSAPRHRLLLGCRPHCASVGELAPAPRATRGGEVARRPSVAAVRRKSWTVRSGEPGEMAELAECMGRRGRRSPARPLRPELVREKRRPASISTDQFRGNPTNRRDRPIRSMSPEIGVAERSTLLA